MPVKINAHTIFIKLLLVIGLISLSSCTTDPKQDSFYESKPKSVGLVIGYDVKAVTSLTAGEEFFTALSFGLIGLAVTESSAKQWKLKFENNLNELFKEKIQKVMQDKEYEIHFLGFKPKKYETFENIYDTKSVYPNLANYYEIEVSAKEFDALLVAEYMLVGRLEGRFSNVSDIENLTADNMKLKYAKSKIFLYDPITQRRIFFDQQIKGFSTFSKTTVSESMDLILNLESVPVVNK